MKALRYALIPLITIALGIGFATADETTKSDGPKKEKPSKATKDKKTTAQTNPTKFKKIVKTEEEWKKQLTPIQYYVTRKKGTELRRTGDTWDLYDPGTYSCVCCDLLLFKSETKFKSGTGWPSFYDEATKGHVATKADNKFGWNRTEILCARCDAHIGHVFEDGPKPTGLRYCANSAALKFRAAKSKDDKKKASSSKKEEKKDKE